MALAVATGVGATLALVAQLVVVALVVDRIFLGGDDLASVAPLLVVAFVLLLLRTVLAVASEVAARRAARRLVSRLRADLTGQVLRLGPTWTSHERSGELSGVLVGGLESIEEYVSTFLPTRWLAMTVPLIVLLLVLALDPPSVVVLLFTGPLLVLLLAVIGGRTRAVSERRFLEMRTLSAFFLDILRGVATLKMFGRSREQVENLARVSRGYGDATMDVLRTAFQTSLVLEWGATIAIALVAVEIGLRLLEGTVPFERALAVLLITPEFFLPLRALAIRFHLGTAGRAVATRTFEILDTPAPRGADRSTAPDKPGAGSPKGSGTEPGALGPQAFVTEPRLFVAEAPWIVFEGVSFTYPGREQPALDGADLELGAGETVALVGASGAGKSTVSSLLLRFIAPDAGAITVDGRSLDSLDLHRWRGSLAWVPQRPHLFEGTIADNIRLARPGADDAAVAAAVQAANAADFIERLPTGLGTPVGEAGARFSGGQRQRLAIARAFLRDAPVVILDEATSHQDEASEAVINEALGRLVVGRTVLVIAHRLRLAQRADRVIVLDRGRVVETGPPALLLANDGPYRRLFDDHGELIAPAVPATESPG